MCREHRFIEEDIVERNVRKRLRSGRAYRITVITCIPCITLYMNPVLRGTLPRDTGYPPPRYGIPLLLIMGVPRDTGYPLIRSTPTIRSGICGQKRFHSLSFFRPFTCYESNKAENAPGDVPSRPMCALKGDVAHLNELLHVPPYGICFFVAHQFREFALRLLASARFF